MNTLRIYLDTSVVNFVFAEDAPDFRAATLRFFERHARDFDLCISDIVLLEIQKDPDSAHREALYRVLDDHNVVVLPSDRREEIERLAAFYIEQGVIPRKKVEDAQHVAYATLFEADILLSWNFKHLANINREARILAANREAGYPRPLRLVSPLEVLDEPDYEA